MRKDAGRPEVRPLDGFRRRLRADASEAADRTQPVATGPVALARAPRADNGLLVAERERVAAALLRACALQEA